MRTPSKQTSDDSILNMQDFPTVWDACTNDQLQYLVAHGSYQQARIAQDILTERNLKP